MGRPPPREARRPRKASKPKDFHAELSAGKRASTLQVLFKVSRLLDELALRRIAALRGVPQLRRSHSSLLPHIDLAGTRLTELADRLGVSKQAAAQLVDDLVEFGVVERVPDPKDGRSKRIVFTELGRRGLLEGLAELSALERELTRDVGDDHMQQLRSALLALDDHLTNP